MAKHTAVCIIHKENSNEASYPDATACSLLLALYRHSMTPLLLLLLLLLLYCSGWLQLHVLVLCLLLHSFDQFTRVQYNSGSSKAL
jgi:hypothetical protein